MQPLAEAGRQFKHAVICHKHDHVARRVENRRADFAGFQMLVDVGAQGRIHLAVDVGGDVLPDVFAVNPHARPPNHPLRLGANPFNCGASSRCSSSARPMQPNLDRALADAQGRRRLADIHLFDVPEEHNVTVNLRQAVDGLAQHGAQFLPLKCLGGNLAPTGQDGRGVVAGLLVGARVEGVLASGRPSCAGGPDPRCAQSRAPRFGIASRRGRGADCGRP